MKEVEDPAQKLYRERSRSLDLDRDVDRFAMWAFFFSIALPLSIFFWPIIVITVFFPFIGMVLSIIALSRIRKNKAKGRGFAVAALILSVVEIIGIFVLLALFGLAAGNAF
ncbi:DUF4190 domain-containing protein [Candidatus Woesearchaeota archaeon]|nr:DUF4190 domain-containing protein [Candidatus Woesearchaeota archaeon]